MSTIYVNGKYEGDDPLGQLVADFHQPQADKFHYKELATGVKHFKEDEEGREIMSEAVETYAEMRAKEATAVAALNEKLDSVQNLMQNMKLSLDQALDALGIHGDKRDLIIKQLQN